MSYVRQPRRPPRRCVGAQRRFTAAWMLLRLWCGIRGTTSTTSVARWPWCGDRAVRHRSSRARGRRQRVQDDDDGKVMA